MTKLARNLKTRRFAALAVSVTLLGILVGGLIGRSGHADRLFSRVSAQEGEPEIKNRTSSIRVVEIQRKSLGKSQTLFVTIQNISSKNIKAYTIASGKAWVTKSYFLDDESFAPNAVEEQIIPLASGAFSSADTKEFSIAAVLFADGTGDGDALYLSRLSDAHAGMRDQANRLLPCLQQLASSLGSQHESVLLACEAETIRLPVNGSGRSSDYENGLQNVQREFLSKLTDIKDNVRSNNFTDATAKRDKVTRILQSLARS